MEVHGKQEQPFEDAKELFLSDTNKNMLCEVKQHTGISF
jgi:hypothetical protein